jgi:DNA mismatch repair protein MSH6
VSTTRLLKTILPAACLWTGLRPVEGFDYNTTLKELINLYPADGDVVMDEDDEGPLPHSVPESIREMVTSKNAIKALGSMIWYPDHLCTACRLLKLTVCSIVGICVSSISIKISLA